MAEIFESRDNLVLAGHYVAYPGEDIIDAVMEDPVVRSGLSWRCNPKRPDDPEAAVYHFMGLQKRVNRLHGVALDVAAVVLACCEENFAQATQAATSGTATFLYGMPKNSSIKREVSRTSFHAD